MKIKFNYTTYVPKTMSLSIDIKKLTELVVDYYEMEAWCDGIDNDPNIDEIIYYFENHTAEILKNYGIIDENADMTSKQIDYIHNNISPMIREELKKYK